MRPRQHPARTRGTPRDAAKPSIPWTHGLPGNVGSLPSFWPRSSHTLSGWSATHRLLAVGRWAGCDSLRAPVSPEDFHVQAEVESARLHDKRHHHEQPQPQHHPDLPRMPRPRCAPPRRLHRARLPLHLQMKLRPRLHARTPSCSRSAFARATHSCSSSLGDAEPRTIVLLQVRAPERGTQDAGRSPSSCVGAKAGNARVWPRHGASGAPHHHRATQPATRHPVRVLSAPVPDC